MCLLSGILADGFSAALPYPKIQSAHNFSNTFEKLCALCCGIGRWHMLLPTKKYHESADFSYILYKISEKDIAHVI